MSTVQTDRIQHSTGTGNNIVLSADGDTQVNSLNGGQLAGFRNQLINGDFRIAQRGTSVTESTSGYRTLDRWYVARSASCEEEQVNNTALEQEAETSNSMRLTPGSAAAIVQGIEITQGRAGCFQQGTTWTLSFYSNREETTVRLGFADGVSGSSNYVQIEAGSVAQRVGTTNRYTYTFTINSSPNGNNSCVRVVLDPSSSEYTDFTGVQLEPGPVATPFEHRPIQTELALCQRYYWTSTSGNSLDGSTNTITYNMLTPQTPNTSSGVFEAARVPFPVVMRSQPTCTYFSTGGASNKLYIHPTGDVDIRFSKPQTKFVSVTTLGAGTYISGIVIADAEL